MYHNFKVYNIYNIYRFLIILILLVTKYSNIIPKAYTASTKYNNLNTPSKKNKNNNILQKEVKSLNQKNKSLNKDYNLITPQEQKIIGINHSKQKKDLKVNNKIDNLKEEIKTSNILMKPIGIYFFIIGYKLDDINRLIKYNNSSNFRSLKTSTENKLSFNLEQYEEFTISKIYEKIKKLYKTIFTISNNKLYYNNVSIFRISSYTNDLDDILFEKNLPYTLLDFKNLNKDSLLTKDFGMLVKDMKLSFYKNILYNIDCYITISLNKLNKLIKYFAKEYNTSTILNKEIDSRSWIYNNNVINLELINKKQDTQLIYLSFTNLNYIKFVVNESNILNSILSNIK